MSQFYSSIFFGGYQRSCATNFLRLVRHVAQSVSAEAWLRVPQGDSAAAPVEVPRPVAAVARLRDGDARGFVSDFRDTGDDWGI